MRFTYAETFCDPAFLAPLAQAAEDAGYDSFAVSDALIYPAVSETTYPYTGDGGREFLEDKPVIEPFTLIPYLVATTSRISFTTLVLKLAVRPAVLVAKQAASIAVLSNNRLRLGVGLSPWPEDFAALGQPWEQRGQRMDEAIDVIRGLTAGGYYEHRGELLDIPRVKITPAPTQPIPILVGGHSDAALRRAVRIGDGWIHAGGEAEDLIRLMRRLDQLRIEYGRGNASFEIHVISTDAFSVDGVRRLEDAGVTDAVVGFRNPHTTDPDTQTLSDKIDLLRRFADTMWAR